MSVSLTSFKLSYSPSLHSLLSPCVPVSAGGEASPGLGLWWKLCGAAAHSDAKEKSAIGFMRNKPSRRERRFWKPVPNTPGTLSVPSPLSLLMSHGL